jgi:hypothetical protein
VDYVGFQVQRSQSFVNGHGFRLAQLRTIWDLHQASGTPANQPPCLPRREVRALHPRMLLAPTSQQQEGHVALASEEELRSGEFLFIRFSSG